MMSRVTLAALALTAAVLFSAVGFAQAREARSSVYFAYVPINVTDRNGQPILDLKTNQPKMDGFCLVWRRGWVHENPDVKIFGGWYTRLSYSVFPPIAGSPGQLTVYEVSGPNVEVTSGGVRRLPGEITMRTRLLAQLYPEPQPGWPCSRETWAAVLGHPARHYDNPAPLPPSAPGPSFEELREQKRKMACDNPQIPSNLAICEGR